MYADLHIGDVRTGPCSGALEFGKGAIEGLAGPEACNNAGVGTAFVPTLTLGIPGDAIMALMRAALTIQGIR